VKSSILYLTGPLTLKSKRIRLQNNTELFSIKYNFKKYAKQHLFLSGEWVSQSEADKKRAMLGLAGSKADPNEKNQLYLRRM